MSNYYLKAKNRLTGEIVEFTALDNHFGQGLYGYKNHSNGETHGQIMFDNVYEIVEEPNIMDRVNLKTISIDDGDGGFITVVESKEYPNHPYGGIEVLDNVPVIEDSSTPETWEDRFEVLWGYGSKQEIKDLFQQELDRISEEIENTEIVNTDGNILIGGYDLKKGILNIIKNR